MSRLLHPYPGETWLITWDDESRQRENGGLGICNTGSGVRCICVLGGIGCNVDHVTIARKHLAASGF